MFFDRSGNPCDLFSFAKLVCAPPERSRLREQHANTYFPVEFGLYIFYDDHRKMKSFEKINHLNMTYNLT